MTGTASEFNETHENNADDLHKINLLSAWIYGKINTNCILDEIDDSGCKLLIPKKSPCPANNFRLIIMCPDNEEKVHTIINAQFRCQDSGSDDMHTIISADFIGMNNELFREISLLHAVLNMPLHQKINCSWMQT